MLKRVEEYSKYLGISGFRGAQLKNARSFSQAVNGAVPCDCEVQLFEADLVATWQHLYFAALNALMAFQNGRNISKSLSVETVLYASAQRQIQKAIEVIGVKPDSTRVAVVVVCGKTESARLGLEAVAKLLGAELDEAVLDLSQAKVQRIRKAFKIVDAEFDAVSARSSGEAALVDLVVERVALLSTRL